MRVDTGRMSEAEEQLKQIRLHMARINEQLRQTQRTLSDVGLGRQEEKLEILKSLVRQSEYIRQTEDALMQLISALRETREAYQVCETGAQKTAGGSAAQSWADNIGGTVRWDRLQPVISQWIKPFIFIRKRE